MKKSPLVNPENFYETETYLELKSEIKNCDGFFIEGKSNSGKSVLASALVRYAMEAGFVYAPIWIRLNTGNEILEILGSKNKNQKLAEYFKNQIE